MKNVFGILIICLMTHVAFADSIVIPSEGASLDEAIRASDAALQRTRASQVQAQGAQMRSSSAGTRAPLKEGIKARKPSKKLETQL